MPIQSKQQPPYYNTQPIIKTFRALANQTGGDPPTMTELINTIGTITWAYTNTGDYEGTCTGAFTGNVYATIFDNSGNPATKMNIYKINNNTIAINTTTSDTPTDALLADTPIEITVYQ